MGNRDPKTLLRAAILIIAVIAVLGFAACGGGGDETGSTASKATQGKSGGETEADAVATGERLCKLLGGKKALSKSFKTSDLNEIAQQFSTQIYIGNFPEAAARGCLLYLKTGAATS
jgi:hypothetical protein